MLVFAIVLGGLMIYFLTPTHMEVEKEFSKSGFSGAFKASFIQTTLHKKAILALLLFVATLTSIWWSYYQMQLYNDAHGIIPTIQPSHEAVMYMTGTTIYTALIYLLLILIRTIKLMKARDI